MENSFENYEALAKSGLSTTEIVGRYKEHEELEEYIFDDIISKLPNLNHENIAICDIGCGCGKVVHDLISLTEEKNSTLTLIDSEYMLQRIEDKNFIQKVPGKFPENQEQLAQKYDVIIVYSVLQVVYENDNVFKFLDSCVEMLNYGGQLLIGDIMNLSKKTRFLKSDYGMDIHKKTSTTNVDHLFNEDFHKMALDDSFIISLLSRYRNAGFNTYLLPQDEKLPFSYTREDILITRNYK